MIYRATHARIVQVCLTLPYKEDLSMNEEQNFSAEVITEGMDARKCWTAPVLTEVSIVEVTHAGLSSGMDGIGEMSTLS